MEQLKPIKPLDLYYLNILNKEYVDVEQSYIDNEGRIFLKLKINVLPSPRNTGYANAEDFLCELYYRSKNIYIVCNTNGMPIDIRAKITLGKQVKTVGLMYEPNILTTALIKLEYFKHTDSYIYIEKTKLFQRFAEDFVKSKIRNVLCANLNGDFVKDQIQDNTYLQQRSLNGEDIFYTIADWWKYLPFKKVAWSDIDNGQCKIYSALLY